MSSATSVRGDRQEGEKRKREGEEEGRRWRRRNEEGQEEGEGRVSDGGF